MKSLVIAIVLFTQSLAFAAPSSQKERVQKSMTQTLKELKNMDANQYRETMFDIAQTYRKVGNVTAADQVENLALDTDSREDLIAAIEDGLLNSSENGLFLIFAPFCLFPGLSLQFGSMAKCLITTVVFGILTLEGEKASDF